MKDEHWYNKKVKDIKSRKRALTKQMKENYGGFEEGRRLDNQTAKQIKSELTKEKRSAKRSVKQNLKKRIQDELDDI